jgi:hypothetical protein
VKRVLSPSTSASNTVVYAVPKMAAAITRLPPRRCETARDRPPRRLEAAPVVERGRVEVPCQRRDARLGGVRAAAACARCARPSGCRVASRVAVRGVLGVWPSVQWVAVGGVLGVPSGLRAWCRVARVGTRKGGPG